MPFLRRLAPLLLVAALAGSVAVLPALASDGAGATASKGKAKGKKCPKGKKAVTVTKNGKKVKVCKKKKTPPKVCARPVAAATASCTPPPPPPPPCGPTTTPACLFEAPGKQLNGDETKPFLQKYLANSTFTDCVTGWPSCGGFENRYSHSTDGTFYQCWLRPTSGSDVKSVGEYGFKDARVEPDGSWIYKELVYWYGHYNLFEWQVTTAGVVTGANLSDSGGATEQIGPLQYVAGVAKDCSY